MLLGEEHISFEEPASDLVEQHSILRRTFRRVWRAVTGKGWRSDKHVTEVSQADDASGEKHKPDEYPVERQEDPDLPAG